MEFNFDEFTIGDFATIQRAIAKPTDPGVMADLIRIIPKFTNTDVLVLPISELSDVIKQFSQAVNEHFLGLNNNE